MVKESDHLDLSPGKYVKISVKDEGTGIAPENIDKIFEPFFTTKQNGTGLGLSSVLSIIENHNGTIKVSSLPGGGAAFQFYLPAAEKALLKKTAETGFAFGKGRVLLTDDEEPIRRSTCRMPGGLGYRAESAPSGEAAVQRFQTARAAGKPFDIIIMDLTVPAGMNGAEAAVKILAIDPRAKIIVSSGYPNHPAIAEADKFGFCGVIVKPYDMKDMGLVLREALGR